MQVPYYLISTCAGGTLVVDITGGAVSVGEIVLLSFAGINPYGCYIVLDTVEGPAQDTATLLDTFASCEECGMTYTGTTVDVFYTSPNDCCDPLSGKTGTGPAYPKPQYANQGGVALQSMSVALGGFNGVNN